MKLCIDFCWRNFPFCENVIYGSMSPLSICLTSENISFKCRLGAAIDDEISIFVFIFLLKQNCKKSLKSHRFDIDILRQKTWHQMYPHSLRMGEAYSTLILQKSPIQFFIHHQRHRSHKRLLSWTVFAGAVVLTKNVLPLVLCRVSIVCYVA